MTIPDYFILPMLFYARIVSTMCCCIPHGTTIASRFINMWIILQAAFETLSLRESTALHRLFKRIDYGSDLAGIITNAAKETFSQIICRDCFLNGGAHLSYVFITLSTKCLSINLPKGMIMDQLKLYVIPNFTGLILLVTVM